MPRKCKKANNNTSSDKLTEAVDDAFVRNTRKRKSKNDAQEYLHRVQLSEETTQPNASNIASQMPKIEKGNESIKASECLTVSKNHETGSDITDVDANNDQIPIDKDIDMESGCSKNSDNRLPYDWFDCPCVDLAKNLLGMKLVRLTESGERRSGYIVETESYLGADDKAAHSYNGKRTERNKAMFMKPGTSYVYNIYGIYTCINISSKGEGAAVLIRSLEPCDGEDSMKIARRIKKSEKSKELKRHELCNGPSKLTQALGITKENGDQVDLTTSSCFWVEKGNPVPDSSIIACKRIGINYAGDWVDKPLRFYVKGCKYVSIRDKAAEANCS